MYVSVWWFSFSQEKNRLGASQLASRLVQNSLKMAKSPFEHLDIWPGSALENLDPHKMYIYLYSTEQERILKFKVWRLRVAYAAYNYTV